MENQIFEVGAGLAKSMVLRENEIWLSTDKVSSIEKFEKAVGKTGIMRSAYIVPLSSLNEISYNEASQSTKIKYTDEKGKEKKLNIGFDEVDLSNQFGQYLGEKMNFSKETTQENQIKPLLWNGFFLLLTIASTIVIGTLEDTSSLTESASRRNRGGVAILKMIVDAVGQTGVFVIGGLISAYLCYQLYKRFKNPSSEILYSRG